MQYHFTADCPECGKHFDWVSELPVPTPEVADKISKLAQQKQTATNEDAVDVLAKAIGKVRGK